MEAFYNSCTGKQGAIVVSFGSKEAGMKKMDRVEDVELVDAYSCRSSSNACHVVRS